VVGCIVDCILNLIEESLLKNGAKVESLRMGLRLSMPKFNTLRPSSRHFADGDFHGI
jgi:hypothetical protein